MYIFNKMDTNTKSLFEKAIMMCKGINIPISNNITFKLDSAERRHGCCSWCKTTDKCTISISKYLVNDDDKLNTIIHELLHSCPDGHSHGYAWQRYADKIYKAYNIRITRCSNKEHTQVDIAHSKRQYFSKEEYEMDGGKFLVAVGRVDQPEPLWYIKKTSKIVKNLDKYTCRGKKLIIFS